MYPPPFARSEAQRTKERRAYATLNQHSPADQALFIPNTTAAGGALSVKKSVIRSAIEELVQLRWLSPPEGDGRQLIYEFVQDERLPAK